MLKNKFILFIIIVLSVFSLFCGSVYATEDTSNVKENGFVYTDNDGKTYRLPVYPKELEEYNHYVVFEHSSRHTFVLIPFNETIEFVSYKDCFDVLVDGKKFGMHWDCNFLNGVTPESWNVGMISSSGDASYMFSTTNNEYTVVTSCLCLNAHLTDIENAINSSDGFFLSRQGILVPIVEKTPLEKVMAEILEILPVILMTIVGLIGLRKALKFLSTVLHRS